MRLLRLPRCAGSIPAHAGEPLLLAWLASSIQVDPRSRGGASGRGCRCGCGGGRSPLTRGSPPMTPEEEEALGSIPAHAGEP